MGNEVQGGNAEASCPQDRTGGARSVKLSGPLPTGPSSTGRRSCLKGGVTQRKVSAGCVPRSGRWEPAPRAACPPPGSCASQHQEEEQHDQQDGKEDGYGTPLAPITGHV